MVSRDFSRDKRLLTARQFTAVFDSPTSKVPGKHILLLRAKTVSITPAWAW